MNLALDKQAADVLMSTLHNALHALDETAPTETVQTLCRLVCALDSTIWLDKLREMN